MDKDITIGMDLGDKTHELCVLDGAGEVLERREIPGTRQGLRKALGSYPGALVVVETGTHSRWVNQEAEGLGHEVLVGNARKLRMIWQRSHKSDVRDAEMLARIGRFDRKLLYPVKHRSEEAHLDLELIKARDLLVRSRTNLINHVRSVVKSHGERVPKHSANAFGGKAQVPQPLREGLEPLLQTIRELTERIKGYEKKISILAGEKYPETKQLTQVVGVGPLTALAYLLTLEDPGRFQDSRMVGAFLGLVPRRDQSGRSDKQLRITKEGNAYLRRLMVGSAHYILGPFGPPSDLRAYGVKLMKRGGKNAKRRAIVAVARKLSVLLYALWVSQAEYEPCRWSRRRAEQEA